MFEIRQRSDKESLENLLIVPAEKQTQQESQDSSES